MKKAFLIHGWDGNPDNSWFPWLKQKLEEQGYQVKALAMPDPEEPKIDAWVDALKQNIQPDEETILIGHSIGCQAILRYLETLDNVNIAGVFLVAAFLRLKGLESKEEEEIAKPWIETPIAWDKVRQRAKKFVVILSDNDEFVYHEDAYIFEEKLGAETIIEHDLGHFDDDAGIKELHSLLNKIMK